MLRIDFLNYLLGELFREKAEKARCGEITWHHRRSDVSECDEGSSELPDVFA